MVFIIDLNSVMNDDEDDSVIEAAIETNDEFDLNTNPDHDCIQPTEDDSPEHITENTVEKVWIPDCSEDMKPHIGQFFLTIDAAFEFYKDYGRRCGFDIRRSTTKKHKDGSVYLKYFLCSNAGVYENVDAANSELDYDLDCSSTNILKQSAEETSERTSRGIKRKRASSKCACNAKLVLKSDGLKGFKVSLFKEDHNHELASDSGKQFLRCSRAMTINHMKFIFDASKANMGATKAFNLYKNIVGSYSEVGATVIDFKNFARDIKLFIGKHDADMILQKFKDKHETSDKKFMYDYQIDSNGHITRIFWADPKGRRSYEVFGDVVCFDATYRTNRYNMVFVPFIGLDNHWKSVTFAAALLSKEDTINFGWVCDAFLKIMGRPPICIVTDQCPAMKAVIPVKFPGSIHRLCMWHIMKKFPSKLGPVFCAESPFLKDLKKFIYSNHASPEEFEQGWKEVIKEYNLENNAWLKEMYELRRIWIPAYFTNDSMASLLRTTSRSESSNFFFGHFLQKGDTLTEFYLCYESAVEKQLQNNSDLNKKNSARPKMITPKKIEQDAADQYTHAIFYKIQDEIRASCSDMELESITCKDESKVFSIKDPFVKNKLFEVHVDLTSTNVDCSCKLFTRVGYLCSHAFFCLSLCGIHQIPRQQLSNRWLKNAEIRYATLQLGDDSDFSKKEQRIQSLRTESWFAFQKCMSIASGEEDLLQLLLSGITDITNKLSERRQKESVPLRNDVIEELIGTKRSDKVIVLPPQQINNKGSRKRIQSSAERSIDGRNRKLRVCKSCGLEGYHDSRTCPEKNKNKEKSA